MINNQMIRIGFLFPEGYKKCRIASCSRKLLRIGFEVCPFLCNPTASTAL